MAEKNEGTRSVWDYMEHGVDFEGKETAGELLGAITADMMQAGSNLQTANRKQEELNREILERNESTMDIDEFLAAEYQNEESKEYWGILLESVILVWKMQLKMISIGDCSNGIVKTENRLLKNGQKKINWI